MPERETYNAYMRTYKRAQYLRLRQKCVDLLGGRCVICASTQDLEIDHIDPTTKSFEISQVQSHSWAAVLVELEKCQLLCAEHHKVKSIRERGLRDSRMGHGTISTYRYCGPPKCESCKAAKRAAPSYQRRFSSAGRAGAP